jgi:parallel beta-helix repeat protein
MITNKKKLAIALVILFLLSSETQINTVIAQFSSDIIIDKNGSITPSTAPIQKKGAIYIFTDDIIGILRVQSSNIQLDGNGKAISSIIFNQVSNVTVKNFKIIMNSKVSGIGLSINNSTDCLTENNFVTGFWSIYAMNGIDYGGIFVINGNSNLFVKNNISNNLVGMEFINTTGNYIIQNTISSNPNWSPCTSLIQFVWSSNNSIYHNNFINGTNNVSVFNSVNSWDNGSYAGGNFWSDYNGNGKYVIAQNNTDNYPLTRLFDIYASNPNPTIPEFPITATLIAVLAVVSLLLIIGKRKISSKLYNLTTSSVHL